MISFQSFADELTKIAATHAEKADAHHSSDVKDWGEFEKNLRSIGFQKAVLEHGMTDDKLKKYVKNYGGYLKAKEVVGTEPSRTSAKNYKIKQLPSGRLACGCGDWQYKHSVKGTDCDHIKAFKAGKKKQSSVAMGISGYRQLGKIQDEYKKGQQAKAYDKAMKPKDKWLPSMHDLKETFLD